MEVLQSQGQAGTFTTICSRTEPEPVEKIPKDDRPELQRREAQQASQEPSKKDRGRGASKPMSMQTERILQIHLFSH